MKTQLLITGIILSACCFLSAQKTLLQQLNSPSKETNLSISPNGKYLYFMSTRGQQKWSKLRSRKNKDTGSQEYDGDLYFSENIDGIWTNPKCLDKSVNTHEGEDEPNVTTDGQRVYFQSFRDGWTNSGGPYYMAKLNGAVWENPVGLSGEITRFFKELSERTRVVREKRIKQIGLYDYYLKIKMDAKESYEDSLRQKGLQIPDFWIATDGMAISPDEKIFIVAAYSPENDNYDLFISRKNDEGIWTYPRPLNVNTKGDEKSIFIAADNQTIYFASDRPGGFGGLDVYKATLTEGATCDGIENIGAKFNSAADDSGLRLDAKGKSGFMVSAGDVYKVSLVDEDIKAIVINGIVVDGEGNPVLSSADLFEAGNPKAIRNGSTNLITGAYSFSIKRQEGEYRQSFITKEGIRMDTSFLVKSSSPDVLNFEIIIQIPKSPKADVVTALEKAELREGEIFRIDKLQFDINSSVITANYFPVLDQMATVLKLRRNVKVEIGGHTNGLVSLEFGTELSTKRALAVYNYLIKKGVPSENLQYQGYGKSNPVATNETKVGRELNQRVEIKVVTVK